MRSESVPMRCAVPGGSQIGQRRQPQRGERAQPGNQPFARQHEQERSKRQGQPNPQQRGAHPSASGAVNIIR